MHMPMSIVAVPFDQQGPLARHSQVIEKAKEKISTIPLSRCVRWRTDNDKRYTLSITHNVIHKTYESFLTVIKKQ